MYARRHIGFDVLTAATLNRSILWAVTPCNLVEVHWRFGVTLYLHLQDRKKCFPLFRVYKGTPLSWKWRQYVPVKQRWTSTKLHGATSHETGILTLFQISRFLLTINWRVFMYVLWDTEVDILVLFRWTSCFKGSGMDHTCFLHLVFVWGWRHCGCPFVRTGTRRWRSASWRHHQEDWWLRRPRPETRRRAELVQNCWQHNFPRCTEVCEVAAKLGSCTKCYLDVTWCLHKKVRRAS